MSGPGSESGLPGCVLFLLQGSPGADRQAQCAARLHIEQALDWLLRRRGGSQTSGMELGVIGYSCHEERVSFAPLLPSVEHSSHLVPLLELNRAELRQVRLEQLSSGGKAPPAEGLVQAHYLVQRWLAWHPGARPPVVLHFGDSKGYGPMHARLSRSLRLLGSATGAVGLAHHVLAPGHSMRFLAEPRSRLSLRMRRLWKHSSPVLLKGPHRGVRPGRALAINADPLALLRGLVRQHRPLRPASLPVACPSMRVLTLPKRGHEESQNEDAVALDAASGRAVLSDGASEGIFVAPWARLLVNSCLSEQPDPSTPGKLQDWLEQRRKTWLKQINLPGLRWSQQNRVEQVGAAGTLLAWQLTRTEKGKLLWWAWAIGDSCLFWVRGNRLHGSFPLAHSRHFNQAPNLLGTRPRQQEPAPLFGGGVCRPGDLFVLASDALARHFLAGVEAGREPNWNELETIPEDTWRSRVDGLRDHDLVNDDCTVIVARVQP